MKPNYLKIPKKIKEEEKGERDRKTLCGDPEWIAKLENLMEERSGAQKEFVQYIVELLEIDSEKQRVPGSADMTTLLYHSLAVFSIGLTLSCSHPHSGWFFVPSLLTKARNCLKTLIIRIGNIPDPFFIPDFHP